MHLMLKYQIVEFFAHLVKLVDTSDLKSDSFEYRFKSDNEYILNQNDGIGRHTRFRF